VAAGLECRCVEVIEFGHIRRVNTMLGLFVPTLVTPLELLGGNDGTESQ
jgi:hypothetical protein